MAIISAVDFRLGTLKPWTANLVLTEGDGTDAFLDAVIAQITSQVESDLNDDFEPAGGDPDETIDVDSFGTFTLYLPRRTRALTSVSTRDVSSVLTLQLVTTYSLRSSLNAAGTGFNPSGGADRLVALTGLTTYGWPYGHRSVQLVGKFGWAAPPDGVKRLVALRVYDYVKATGDPLSTVVQRATIDQTLTMGPSREMEELEERYRNMGVLVG